jgi:hypothetical protein
MAFTANCFLSILGVGRSPDAQAYNFTSLTPVDTWEKQAMVMPCFYENLEVYRYSP